MRPRIVAGLVAAVMILPSSAAHSLMGWPQLRAGLAAANAPPDLVTALSIGWHFGGAVMLALGAIIVQHFLARRAGRPGSPVAIRALAVLYLVFGACAALTGRDAFFLVVFVLPGALLAVAAFGDDTVHPGPTPPS